MPTPVCALCADTLDISACAVAPRDETAALCAACRTGMEGAVADDPRWRCLVAAIWSETSAIQVTAWRLLKRLQGAPWAARRCADTRSTPTIRRISRGGSTASGSCC